MIGEGRTTTRRVRMGETVAGGAWDGNTHALTVFPPVIIHFASIGGIGLLW
jgi:hypothetical protein